jgi:RNA polymerase sigma-70 factor, ECF subfamily
MTDAEDKGNAIGDEDRALVAELRAGAPGSYERLVRAHGSYLLRVARRLLRNEDDARDCVQETFVLVFRKVGEFEGRSSLRSWLHRIAVNCALMKIRSARRILEDSIEDLLPHYDDEGHRVEPESEFAASVETTLENAQIGDLVRRAIDRLPDGYRTVLLLRDIEDYTTQETAAALGIEEGAVKTRLHRARAALKTLLSPVLAEQAGKPQFAWW